jgi:isopentenyl-diphosphate delta-isomerase
MGVGSQRAAIEKKELEKTYSVIKEHDIPLVFSNIGVSQIVEWGAEKTLDYANEMIEMIDADVFTICLNFLQEIVQSEGDSDAKGAIEVISYLTDNLDTPVIAKESGAGISYDVAKKLLKVNISGIDVGGLSGTSFSAIEYYRSKKMKDKIHERGGKTFWNWGIPTPTSIIEVVDATENKIPVIATGGIRNGLDTGKAIVLGADTVGIANNLLKPAVQGSKETMFEIEAIIKELRATMFLTGSKTIDDLKNVDWAVTGDKLWM